MNAHWKRELSSIIISAFQTLVHENSESIKWMWPVYNENQELTWKENKQYEFVSLDVAIVNECLPTKKTENNFFGLLTSLLCKLINMSEKSKMYNHLTLFSHNKQKNHATSTCVNACVQNSVSWIITNLWKYMGMTKKADSVLHCEYAFRRCVFRIPTELFTFKSHSMELSKRKTLSRNYTLQ